MLYSFGEIISAVKSNTKKQKVAVVGAAKSVAIEAANDIRKEQLGEPVLFGELEKINELLKGTELENNVEIVDCADDESACHTAVDYAAEGKVDLILKGTVETAALMKAIFRKENGLKSSPVIADVMVFEDPIANDKKRLIGLTDGGLVPLPDLETKIEMTRSAVKVFNKLGFEKPKVAYISAVEKVSPKIQSTIDADEIKKRKQEGKLDDINAYLEGPYAIDNVISEMAAKIKGIDSVMAGCADILVMPNIESGNVLGKVANYWCNAQNGHVITGAKVPVLITSRADDAKTKLNSVALGILVSMK
jgi:phosphate butyryltransferase